LTQLQKWIGDWSERVHLYNRQIMPLPRKTKTYCNTVRPRAPFRTAGSRWFVPAFPSPLSLLLALDVLAVNYYLLTLFHTFKTAGGRFTHIRPVSVHIHLPWYTFIPKKKENLPDSEIISTRYHTWSQIFLSGSSLSSVIIFLN
jgi:hypothetical protein